MTKKIIQTQNTTKGHVRDRSSLSSLYPSPKTYEERQHDLEQRQKMIQERLPRRITLSTGLLLYGLLVIIAIAAALIPRFIVWNAISGVFWSFMVVMIAMSAGYGIFKTISDRLYRLGLVSSQFIVAYVSSIIPLAGSFLHRITQAGLPVGAMVILLSILHFLLVFVILKTLQQQTMSSSQKAGRLILIAALSLCFAVFVILVV